MFFSSSMLKRSSLVLLSITVAMGLSLHATAQSTRKTAGRGQTALPTSISILEGTRERDGLIGPVRRVRTETAKLSMKSGKLTEGPRQLLETTVYNLAGDRIDNTYYPVAKSSNPVGKEEYKYDGRGNLTEMTLRDQKGAILSREVYAYEFDTVGNWNRMITSLMVYENGLRYEPVEVTYRAISYYFNESIAKVENSTSSATTAPVVPSAETVKKTGARGRQGVAPRSESRPNNPPTPKENSRSLVDLSREAGAHATGSQVGNDSLLVKTDGNSPGLGRPKARLISGGSDSGELVIPKAAYPVIPKAAYPEEAKRAGVSGIVAVKVTLDPEGNVIAAVAVSGPPMLRASAVEAALGARLSPASSKTQSKRSAIITFTFSLLPG